ncbi:ribosome biogenesis GTPase Der [Desulfoferrobacter suflitae]|uniref:ribosome biogenesis GTPase Der n=1 Tax=Desulfoferrobacter suflitae TaxID=2865782 RepID=UPI002164D55A|nr:ribosome biogenesis GTPase Der [Desulfoferrobacter suflitae]MCK8600681.1 ribosome biogenesis GTPase Der [Desulfoferrobacter suflitae]
MTLIAIVGRPNVGKSTLFNRIRRRRQALVDDVPGVTRDRNYAQVTWEGKPFTIIDTAGFVSHEFKDLDEQTREQIRLAVDEADLILFIADGKTGLHPEDKALVNLLRRTSKPVYYAVNKIDGPGQEQNISEFFELGLDKLHPISAAHGFGMGELMSDLLESIRTTEMTEVEQPNEIRVAIVGRPNVGKSTLTNRILGAPRVIVDAIPGTTRDAIDSPFEHAGQRYVLIDTAGIRRKGRTREKLEKISVIKALQSIDRSHVAVLLTDAGEGITDQDLHIAGYVQERSRACVIGINKWDAIDTDPRRTKLFMEGVQERFKFLPFAPILTISALTGKRVARVIPTVFEVFQQYNQRITTGHVNRALEQALERHEPPQVAGRPLKFYYATQTSVRPPTFVLFCNRPESIHFSYERYLTNQFREAFGLTKTPIRLVFRGRQKGERQR